MIDFQEPAAQQSRAFAALLSFKTIDLEEDYQTVLQLRYHGYGLARKIAEGSNWRHQGEGLTKEGQIVAAFLGEEMVASMELRFSDESAFRLFKVIPRAKLKHYLQERAMEINKLVIHPRFQGSDILLGMIGIIHHFCLLKKCENVFISATDKLTPLYMRSGAVPTSFSYPHPHLANERLNVLVASRKTYEVLIEQSRATRSR